MKRVVYIITRIIKYGMGIVLSIAGVRDLAKAFMFQNPFKNAFLVLFLYSFVYVIIKNLMDAIVSR